jgi:hypothetical protein
LYFLLSIISLSTHLDLRAGMFAFQYTPIPTAIFFRRGRECWISGNIPQSKNTPFCWSHGQTKVCVLFYSSRLIHLVRKRLHLLSICGVVLTSLDVVFLEPFSSFHIALMRYLTCFMLCLWTHYTTLYLFKAQRWGGVCWIVLESKRRICGKGRLKARAV